MHQAPRIRDAYRRVLYFEYVQCRIPIAPPTIRQGQLASSTLIDLNDRDRFAQRDPRFRSTAIRSTDAPDSALLSWWIAKHGRLCVQGQPGLGKRDYLRWLVSQLCLIDHGMLAGVFDEELISVPLDLSRVDIQNVPTPEEIVRSIIASLDVPDAEAGDFAAEITHCLEQGHALVAVNGIQSMLSWDVTERAIRCFRAFIDRFPGARYVVIARPFQYLLEDTVGKMFEDYGFAAVNIEPYNCDEVDAGIRRWMKIHGRDLGLEGLSAERGIDVQTVCDFASAPFNLHVSCLSCVLGIRPTESPDCMMAKVIDRVLETITLSILRYAGRPFDERVEEIVLDAVTWVALTLFRERSCHMRLDRFRAHLYSEIEARWSAQRATERAVTEFTRILSTSHPLFDVVRTGGTTYLRFVHPLVFEYFVAKGLLAKGAELKAPEAFLAHYAGQVPEAGRILATAEQLAGTAVSRAE